MYFYIFWFTTLINFKQFFIFKGDPNPTGTVGSYWMLILTCASVTKTKTADVCSSTRAASIISGGS